MRRGYVTGPMVFECACGSRRRVAAGHEYTARYLAAERLVSAHSDELRTPSTLMLGRWLTLQPVSRDPVPLSGIAPVLPLAVIASEDQRFCLDHGVDFGAIRDVVDDEDSPSRGASSA